MFERTRIDNIPEPSAVPVEVTLVDGSMLKGKVLVPVGKVLSDALNSSGPFLEFEPYGGDRRFLAKSQIAALKPVGVPKAGSLNVRGGDTFDPHSVLGVPATAAWDEIRQSYHKLAKLYHPDRYASAALPDEVGEYLANMVRRVNAAYAALDVPQAEKVAAPAPAAPRAQPIYTTGMRV